MENRTGKSTHGPQKSFEKYAEVVEGINRNQTALKETIAMLSMAIVSFKAV